MSEAESRAARIISEHRLARRRLAALDPSVRPADEASAYASQDQLHAILSSAGFGPVAGHKIGCTTRVMQEFLRIPNPCAGGVFASQVHRSPAVVRHADWVRPGVECEMVVSLDADLAAEASAVYPRNRGCGSRRGDGRDGDRRRPLCRLQEPGYAHAHRRRLLRRRLRAGCAGCRLAFARPRVAHRRDADQRRRGQDAAAGRT